ncbi:hypothetical protein Taro_007557 [Colocasia esculenta]|uniref:Uncharacterized protein n=1 Tax=Colocasia esculenta TaxID=4460 RepID=A0A843TUJ8_COLES|nr:hypothetical protein [Colocasia esculenta]
MALGTRRYPNAGIVLGTLKLLQRGRGALGKGHRSSAKPHNPGYLSQSGDLPGVRANYPDTFFNYSSPLSLVFFQLRPLTVDFFLCLLPASASSSSPVGIPSYSSSLLLLSAQEEESERLSTPVPLLPLSLFLHAANSTSSPAPHSSLR